MFLKIKKTCSTEISHKNLLKVDASSLLEKTPELTVSTSYNFAFEKY